MCPQCTPPDDLLDTAATSDLLDIPVERLTYWRVSHRGPKFIRLGAKGSAVRYRRSDLEQWLSDNTVDPQREAA